MNKNTKILLAHGSGGRLTHDLISSLFKRYFDNEYLSPLLDSAEISLGSKNISFTTDSYVVKPLAFPGGDIGKLAICGTINDLAVTGAKPLYISCGFIIEEGFEFGFLEEIVSSMARTASDAGVKIVTGDTKVVERGAADGLFINTTGIGTKIEGVDLGYDQISPGDKIVVNGSIGDHGMAVMASREGLGLSSEIKSDCAPLNDLIQDKILRATSNLPAMRCLPHGMSAAKARQAGEQRATKFMRDPTRGGLATTLCEIAESTGFDIEVDEKSIPISDAVSGIAEILGIDPLYSANEGKVVAIVAPDSAEDIVSRMRTHPLGKNSQIIGEIKDGGGHVNLKTTIGTHRQIKMQTGAQLPRIC